MELPRMRGGPNWTGEGNRELAVDALKRTANQFAAGCGTSREPDEAMMKHAEAVNDASQAPVASRPEPSTLA